MCISSAENRILMTSTAPQPTTDVQLKRRQIANLYKTLKYTARVFDASCKHVPISSSDQI